MSANEDDTKINWEARAWVHQERARRLSIDITSPWPNPPGAFLFPNGGIE